MQKCSKTIIWVLVVTILIGAGIWAYTRWIHPEKVTSPIDPSGTKSMPTSDTSVTEQSDDWKVYENDQYGFSLTLTDKWTGYRWESAKPVEGMTDLIQFYIPTDDELWSPAKPGYANAFSISIYTLAQWNDVDKSGPHDTYIGENDTYVIAFSRWFDCPVDLCDVITMDELETIKDSITLK